MPPRSDARLLFIKKWLEHITPPKTTQCCCGITFCVRDTACLLVVLVGVLFNFGEVHRKMQMSVFAKMLRVQSEQEQSAEVCRDRVQQKSQDMSIRKQSGLKKRSITPGNLKNLDRAVDYEYV